MSSDYKSNSLSGSVIELKENISINNKFKKQDNDELEQQQKIKSNDLNEQNKLILKTVYIILKLGSKNFTINHYIDILKGSKNAKVIKNHHNLLPAYGLFKQIKSRNDVEHILNKLIKNNLLIKGSRSILTIDQALGDRLFKEKIIPTKLSIQTNNDQNLNDNSYLTQYAYQALLNISKEISIELKINYTKIITIDRLQQIAVTLPITENEFIQLANFPTNFDINSHYKKYLKITKLYSNFKEILEHKKLLKDKNTNLILHFQDDTVEFVNNTSSIDIRFNDSASNIDSDVSSSSESEEKELIINRRENEKPKEADRNKRKLSTSSIQYLKCVKR